jgi:hypothetical protein
MRPSLKPLTSRGIGLMPSDIATLTGTGAMATAAAILVMKLLGKPASEVGELFTDYVRGGA